MHAARQSRHRCREWLPDPATKFHYRAIDVRCEEFNGDCLRWRIKHARVRIEPIERRKLAHD